MKTCNVKVGIHTVTRREKNALQKWIHSYSKTQGKKEKKMNWIEFCKSHFGQVNFIKSIIKEVRGTVLSFGVNMGNMKSKLSGEN
jgi:hypothetical protein